MKKLNDISRATGYPITAEVLEVLNNAEYFNHIMTKMNIRGVRKSWTWLVSSLGIIVYFDANGFAQICSSGIDIFEIARRNTAIKNNPLAYNISIDNVYTNISKENGMGEYENVIRTSTARFVEAEYDPVTNKYNGNRFYGMEELILGAENIQKLNDDRYVLVDVLDLLTFANTTDFSFQHHSAHYNKQQKLLRINLHLLHNVSFASRVEIGINKNVVQDITLTTAAPISAVVASSSKVSILPAYYQNYKLILDYSGIVSQYETLINASIRLA
ncbi:MAG: hypothetical protein LBE13_18705 [Bacteroidales bacterium]|jgi:hypothetical protein|nr:hypothetical protein [Bacteroidales bacterium]